MDETNSHAVLDAKTLEECIIEQNWGAYTSENHKTWETLFNRQMETLRGHVCSEYFKGIKSLGLIPETLPDFEKMNRNLRAATGWEVLAVPGLISSRPFFTMLANKQFPAGTFIRTPEQLDYLEEPDIFHDVFGHVPLLSHTPYAAYMQAYGEAGLKAMDYKGVKFLARLNWYTIEFGLVKDGSEIKSYGAGIMSSFGEAQYVRNDPSANFLQFDLERVLRTGYYIDDLQASYFTIDSFDALFEECIARPFIPLYESCRALPQLSPFEITESDTVLREGTGEYWKEFPETKSKLK
jgi:phenylalanine-4-hydroxylase